MKREIKFRGEYQGKVYAVTELLWSDNTAYLWDSKAEDGLIAPLDEVNLLQFTGLKDNNGKEIYEGDMVRNDIGNCTAPVIFIAGSFRIDVGGQPHHFDSDGFEVIGNIYKNPELLK